jgi:cyclic pyranopterin phosphate synthase
MKEFEPTIIPKPRTSSLSHITESGDASMVDVSQKDLTTRDATAAGRIALMPQTIELIEKSNVAKGNVLAAARIAGILAAKQTPQLIPLCHQLILDDIEIGFETVFNGIEITCRVRTISRTGAEMEALTGVTVAALTIYDMCKAVDKGMVIGEIRLVSKSKRRVPQVGG